MRKLLITICILGTFLMADLLTLPRNAKTYIDTIDADSTKATLFGIISRELTGDFSVQYVVRNIAGDTKVKLYYEETNDTLFGWYNKVLIDSCVASDSGLVDKDFNSIGYWKITYDAWGVAADSSFIMYNIKTMLKE